MSAPLLDVRGLRMHFPVRSGLLLRQTGTVHAVDGVSLTVAEGETMGLVGESGCGKTTVGRTVVGIYKPTEGEVRLDGRPVHELRGAELEGMRRKVQMVFQDPYSSLNPRMTIARILEAPLRVHGIGAPGDRRARSSELLDKIGLGAWALDRYPHEFSGGQRQRIAIARAIALSPRLVVADEPVSALDVSVQAQILNLLRRLQEDSGLAYLLVAHDLAVVRHMASRIAVMYLGRIVELADRQELFKRPLHPYTQALLEANPLTGRGRRRQRAALQGDVPSPLTPPRGCHFHPRCPLAEARCREETPVLADHGGGHLAACHLIGRS